MKKFIFPILLLITVLTIDQIIKYLVKSSMFIGEEIHVAGNWFIIHFTENNGMAFGLELGGNYGKLALSVFRLLAVIGIGYIFYYIIQKKYHKGLVVCVTLILAGALGNIIDSVFYGKIYGYAGWLHGRVVDMFYFPIIETQYPEWFPFWAGESLVFFRPVFNFADASISVGVIIIIIFQERFLNNHPEVPSELKEA